MSPAFVTIVALAAVVQYFSFGMRVGMARVKYKVPAPAVTGDENFERAYRVQMNTLEQLVVFLPGIYAFSTYVSVTGAAIAGMVFVLGRALYAFNYLRDPARRGPGMMLTLLANITLVGGGMVGAMLAVT